MNIDDLVQIPNATDANVAEALQFQSKPASEMTASAAVIALPAGVTVISGGKDELLGLADYVLSTLPPGTSQTTEKVQAQIAVLQSL